MIIDMARYRKGHPEALSGFPQTKQSTTTISSRAVRPSAKQTSALYVTAITSRRNPELL
jgi:hypothetical protein